jgi:hypothetical protein
MMDGLTKDGKRPCETDNLPEMKFVCHEISAVPWQRIVNVLPGQHIGCNDANDEN